MTDYQLFVTSNEILRSARNQEEQLNSINNRLKTVCSLLEQLIKSKELKNGNISEEENRKAAE